MIVRLEGISVRYGATVAIDDLTLEARPGAVLCILGPNGSGKSSLIKAIAGIATFDGRILFGASAARPKAIGYMPQDIHGRAALTVTEAVLLGRLGRLGLRISNDDLAAVETILADLDLVPLAGRYLGELSGGQRQLVFLGQAIAAEPQVLLLDEPISALDLRHQLEVLDLVRDLTRKRDLTTICVLHDLNAAARYADRVALFHQGRLAALGRPRDTLTPALLADAFGVETVVTLDEAGIPSITPLRVVAATKRSKT